MPPLVLSLSVFPHIEVTHVHTCERQTGDAGAGERHHCIYSQSGGCVNSWTAHKACCAGHLGNRVTEKIE